MKEYIEVKIKKIQEKSDPEGYLSRLASSDTEIRRLWKTEKENDNVCWRNINTNDDVMNLVNHFDGQVRFVEKNVPYGSGHIMISHRISSARMSNKIIVLDGGKITEQGTHDELVALDGLYAKLYNLQREKYTVKEVE